MRSESSRPTEELLAANWRLSFGDLLTLVLCFFISLAHQGTGQASQNSVSEQQNTQENKDLAVKKLDSPPPATGGTPLANQGVGRRVRQFRIQPSLFVDEGSRLHQEAQRSLQAFLEAELAESDRITLRVCGDSNKPSQAWLQSLSRALELTGLINQVAKDPAQLSVEVRGAQCPNGSGLIELHDGGQLYG